MNVWTLSDALRALRERDKQISDLVARVNDMREQMDRLQHYISELERQQQQELFAQEERTHG